MTDDANFDDTYRMFIVDADCKYRDVRDVQASSDDEARLLLNDALPVWVEEHAHPDGDGKKKAVVSATGRIYRLTSSKAENSSWERVGTAAWTTSKEKA